MRTQRGCFFKMGGWNLQERTISKLVTYWSSDMMVIHVLSRGKCLIQKRHVAASSCIVEQKQFAKQALDNDGSVGTNERRMTNTSFKSQTNPSENNQAMHKHRLALSWKPLRLDQSQRTLETLPPSRVWSLMVTKCLAFFRKKLGI